MKKRVILFALAFLVCISAFAYDVDVIVTRTRTQIQCIIISQEDDYITYHSTNPEDMQVYQIAKSDVEKIYMHNTEQAIEYPKTSPQQEVKKSPKVENFAIQNTPMAQAEISLARMNNYGGTYVFTDCVPIAEYEILGDVYFDKEGKQHAVTYMYYNALSRSVNTAGYTYTETPQYTDIRDALISQAVMANRQVEGVLITITKEGEGRATLIKFKEGTTNKEYAKVNKHLGILVFTDCMPVNNYSFVGKINNAGGTNTDYNVLRDKLIKKAVKKFSNTQGIIPCFVSGGRDTAEAIKF